MEIFFKSNPNGLKGKGDPRDHVHEFYILCQEVSYSDVYVRSLFPKSISEDALSWFFSLPHGFIKSFLDLIEKLVSHYAYNIENNASMMDLCNAKQRPEETFANFLQRWRHLIKKFPWDMLESYQIELFQLNLLS